MEVAIVTMMVMTALCILMLYIARSTSDLNAKSLARLNDSTELEEMGCSFYSCLRENGNLSRFDITTCDNYYAKVYSLKKSAEDTTASYNLESFTDITQAIRTDSGTEKKSIVKNGVAVDDPQTSLYAIRSVPAKLSVSDSETDCTVYACTVKTELNASAVKTKQTKKDNQEVGEYYILKAYPKSGASDAALTVTAKVNKTETVTETATLLISTGTTYNEITYIVCLTDTYKTELGGYDSDSSDITEYSVINWLESSSSAGVAAESDEDILKWIISFAELYSKSTASDSNYTLSDDDKTALENAMSSDSSASSATLVVLAQSGQSSAANQNAIHYTASSSAGINSITTQSSTQIGDGFSTELLAFEYNDSDCCYEEGYDAADKKLAGLTGLSVETLSDINTKSGSDLAAWAQNAYYCGWQYVKGGVGQVFPESFTSSYIYQYYSSLTGAELQNYIDSKSGQRIADCIGLIKGYSWLDLGSDGAPYINFSLRNVSGHLPDLGVQGMWDYITSKSNIWGYTEGIDYGMFDASQISDTSNFGYSYDSAGGSYGGMPDIPGLIVFYSSKVPANDSDTTPTSTLTHVGIYIGDGWVIDASRDVSDTEISDSDADTSTDIRLQRIDGTDGNGSKKWTTKWTCWAKVPTLSY